MNEGSAAQSIRIAAAHRQAGRLAEAGAICRQILAQEPNHPDALHLLGVTTVQLGQADAGIELIRRAIAINPGAADYHNNLGIALRGNGQLDEAVSACRQALRIKPGSAQTYNNLGAALSAKGSLDEAMAAYREAIALKPDYADAHNNLGIALAGKGQLDEAVASYRQAIALKPNYAEAHNNLGNVLAGKGQLGEAIVSYRQAIALKPNYAEAHNNLGIALKGTGQHDEAIAAHRQAIALRPNYAEAHNSLGNALADKGQLDDAIAAYSQAIAFRTNYAEAHNNLGNALKGKGQLDEAIAAFRQAIRLKPDYAAAHSNLVYNLHFHCGYDAGMIYEEHRRWSEQFAEPLKKFIQPHTNNRDPDRRLRIGYVSPDFCNHPVGRFLLPLLAAHDRDRFAVFCYADDQRRDDLTALLRRHADQWRSTVGLTDERLAQLIREDQIDILVDLTMHMAKNRMFLFARKPAPVQVTYLAYCSTTGLETMDYRLTDSYLDAPGMDDRVYCEKSIRLPQTYWCYPLDDQSPQVGPPPAPSAGEVTFGCLNNFCKVSPEALAVWIQLLRAMPKSHLILHADEGSHRQRVRDLLEHQAVDPRRLSFMGKVARFQYFKLYDQIDIALDPFPCNGGTTTCDALWMGVPVVTLRGRTAVGRAGVSILSNVGLTDWIADNPRPYVSIAQQMAGDLPRLAELRSTLRRRMLASPLMDGKQFAHDVEAAFRRMWEIWCSKPR